jgi:hypothetical protein
MPSGVLIAETMPPAVEELPLPIFRSHLPGEHKAGGIELLKTHSNPDGGQHRMNLTIHIQPEL